MAPGPPKDGPEVAPAPPKEGPDVAPDPPNIAPRPNYADAVYEPKLLLLPAAEFEIAPTPPNYAAVLEVPKP